MTTKRNKQMGDYYTITTKPLKDYKVGDFFIFSKNIRGKTKFVKQTRWNRFIFYFFGI